MLQFLFELMGDLIGSSGLGGGLNTRKIDRHIEKLKEHEWFKIIYEDEKYYRLFFVNKHVRGYLQSSFRVRKMIRNKEVQRAFIQLLNRQIN